jgi:hypothetical protein
VLASVIPLGSVTKITEGSFSIVVLHITPVLFMMTAHAFTPFIVTERIAHIEVVPTIAVSLVAIVTVASAETLLIVARTAPETTASVTIRLLFDTAAVTLPHADVTFICITYEYQLKGLLFSSI